MKRTLLQEDKDEVTQITSSVSQPRRPSQEVQGLFWDRDRRKDTDSPGMPCGGVPHDHDLGHVAELGEILFQPVLSGLPRETADEHLSGDWIMVNGHYLFRLMSDDGDDCGDEEHLSRDWKHHYLFRLASPPLSIPFLRVSCGGPAPNIVNNSGFLAKGHCKGQMATLVMMMLVMIQMISHPGSLEWPLSEEDPPPPPPSAVSIVFSISLKLQTSQSVPIRHAEAMCSRLWLGD